MAYKTVNSLDADVTITIGGQDKKTGKKNPTSVEGFYLGSREVETQSKYGNGPSVLYFFQTEKGNVGVWGKTDLKKKLAAGKLGLMTLVTYAGMKPTPRGDMHTYKVEQDPDVSIDVSDLNALASTGSGGEEDYNDGGDADEEEEEEAYEPEVAAVAFKETPEQRKAKVQALLNRNKAK